MFRKLAMSLVLLAAISGSLLAQCDCSGCNNQPSFFERGCTPEWRPGFGGSDGDACACGPAIGGHYLSVFGGYVDIDNFERTREIVQPPGNVFDTFIDGAKLQDDFAWGAALGRQVHKYARGEFELTVRENEVSSWFEQEFDNAGILIANNVTAAAGTLQSYSGVFNVLFDFYDRKVGCPGMYLGGGIGAIYVDGNFAAGANTYDISDSSFAYQLIGGINYAVSDRVDLFTEYRYVGADYLTVDNTFTGQSLGDFTIDTHNVFFGARIRR